MSNIYKEIILDHWRNPHNFGKLKSPTKKSYAINPSCGDEIQIDLIIKKEKIKEVKFSGRGCAISQASASLLTDYIKGKSIKDLKKIDEKTIIKLLGIKISPTRMKCALLPLETLETLNHDRNKH